MLFYISTSQKYKTVLEIFSFRGITDMSSQKFKHTSVPKSQGNCTRTWHNLLNREDPSQGDSHFLLSKKNKKQKRNI